MGLIQYELPEELHVRYRRAAQETGETMKVYLRRALTAAVERTEAEARGKAALRRG